MIFKHFYDTKLAQASYLVGCAATGEAVVVDANRDIDAYIRAAEAEGLRITAVTETHIHADFVSGSRELARRTGARLYLSREGGPDWQYAFAEADGAVLLRDGDGFFVGNVRIDAIHTPGHTPEHLSFAVTDLAAVAPGAEPTPMGVFTGDFLFVGDVGRPDLLEKAAGVTGTMEAGARDLFESLRRFTALPDHVQIWPGHGAGSACGKALGAVPQTTLGYERRYNPALQFEREEDFVAFILEGQPEPPVYFAHMKRINRDGPALLGRLARPERLAAARILELREHDALIVDTRPAAAFAAGHVPGALNLPLDRNFTTWAGWLLPYDRDIYLLVDERCESCLDEAIRDLALIGLDRVAGYFSPRALEAWTAAGRRLGTGQKIDREALDRLLERQAVTLVDVRSEKEWRDDAIPGAIHMMLGAMPAQAAQLSAERPVVVYCKSGARAAIAASVLRARGIAEVFELQR